MLVWVVVRAIAHGRMSWHVVAVFVAAGAGVWRQVAICGLLACFSPGAARAIGWFLVIGSIAAALAHHFVAGDLRHAPARLVPWRVRASPIFVRRSDPSVEPRVRSRHG